MRWTSLAVVLLASFSSTDFSRTYAFLPPRTYPLDQCLLGARNSVPRVCLHSRRTGQPTKPLCGVTSKGNDNDSGSSSSSSAEGGVALASPPPLPPKDDTYASPFSFLREWRSAPRPPAGSARYDTVGKATGGIWRSKFLGMQPITVVTPALATSWLSRAESTGDVFQSWPKSVREILGSKSASTLGEKPSMHRTLRGLYLEALSPKAVVKLTPFIESCLARRAGAWDEMANKGEEVRMLDEIAKFTMEVIVYAFLGDFGTEKVVQDCFRLVPEASKGLFSIPRRFWWPLNRIFPFNFGRAMKARKEFNAVMAGVVEERRSESSAVDGAVRTGGALDRMLEMQAKQLAAGGPKDGEMEYDDSFIYDNIYTALFAGFDTTASTLARILQFLNSNESKELGLKARLLEELRGGVSVEEGHVKEQSANISSNFRGSSADGIFRAFPLLDAVVLESNRMSPAVGGVLRKTDKAMEYNGFLIPEGETIGWILYSGYVSESFYPQHTKFCPYRFLQGWKDVAGTSPSNGAMSPAEALKDQPRPQMFGFGKHLCPGKELSKLEIVLFLKFFLPKYGYQLVEGQKLQGSMARDAPKDGFRLVLKTISG